MKDVTIARVYLKEGDKAQGHNLLQQIFRLLHDEHKVHGVTVFRGIAGFGSHGEVHADDLLRVAVHLPLVLEFFDTPEAVAAVLPRIQELVPAEHIVTWQARCGA
ncbi:DUF190 domain-containing protein [Thiomonas sp.]|jgi:PII-like signaling protein|uniref:DUF190 domain-containing protein n=1 Tax=Thiomonas sp. TaxID=2047785 RepID=UPI002625D340|nr:DUF190 domain-containing protein [Thiomonas sp.]